MKWIVFFILMTLIACESKKSYKVIIYSRDSGSLYISEDTVQFKCENDTSAFKVAHKRYWIKKLAIMEVDKKLGSSQAMPFIFSVIDDKDNIISFPNNEEERLTKEMNDYVQKIALPKIDTITPISKTKKEEPAKIY